MFTQEELKNIFVLIQNASIKDNDSLLVISLLVKIQKLLKETQPVNEKIDLKK